MTYSFIHNTKKQIIQMIFKRLCGVVDRVHGLDYIISKYLTPRHTLVQKYLNLSGLTMNPGAPWMSSVGTVKSRMAASANTSSTIGIARVKRWAMWWKWAVSLLCGRDGNLSLGLIARGGVKKWLPRAQMLSQPACDSRFASRSPRVLHFTWAGRAGIWIYVPPLCSRSFPQPLCSANESNSKATGAVEGKMFLSQPELLHKLLLICILGTVRT